MAGRYRLRERQGGWAGSLLWIAEDEELGRPVIVWVFPPGFGRVRAVVAAARAACQLDDPRLTRIFDADDRGQRPYVVTERPVGSHLGELVAAAPLEPGRAAGLIAEAAGALAVAHASGLAHLCLRPTSLWCDASGEVKVGGLGIAAAAAGAQAADPGLADTRGLSELLYAALTGYWPGAEQTVLPAAPRRGGQVDPPSHVRAGIPSGIDAVTCQALAAEPGRAAHQPILHPAQLAQALAEVTGAGSPRRRPAPLPGHAGPPAALASAQVPAPASPGQSGVPGNRGLEDTTVPARTTPLVPAPPASTAPPPAAAAASSSRMHQPALAAVAQSAPVTAPAPAAAPSPPVTSRQRPHSPARPGPATEPGGPQPTSTAPGAHRHPGTGTGRPPRAQRTTSKRKALPWVMLMFAVVAALAAGGWQLARPRAGPPGSAATRAPAPPTAAPPSAWQPLRPVSAQAFDPYGNGRSDNSQLAPLAIDHNPATAWHTDWYTTAHFGNLKPGTGLLVDLGRAITLARARIKLGTTPGADLQLRAGTTATSLKGLPVIARAANAASWVSVHLRNPVHARYLLIWFTKLPPDPAGTFQASIFSIRLKGRP